RTSRPGPAFLGPRGCIDVRLRRVGATRHDQPADARRHTVAHPQALAISRFRAVSRFCAPSAASRLKAHFISGSITNLNTRRTGEVHNSVTAPANTTVTKISPS